MSVAVKICGLTTVSAVEATVDAGADAIGIVFASSVRQVEPKLGLKLFRAIPEGILRVAVFREPDPVLLAAVCRFPVDAVQTHASWRGELPRDIAWLPAFRDGADLVQRVTAWRPSMVEHPSLGGWPARCFVDGPKPGSGRPGDPSRAAAAARIAPIAVAGGLAADNVAACIAAVRPVAVDVSSGVESAPGVKDPARITAFIEAVRSVETP